MEVWKDIEGYEGLYQISNMGRVKSFWKAKKLIMQPVVVNDGYHSISLTKDEKQKSFLIHRLVAKAFIPNPENKLTVNHKDGNKKNNHVDNLEWATSSENTKHSFDILKRKNSRWSGYLNIFSKNGQFITQVNNSKEAAEWVRKKTKYHKADACTICKVCTNKRRSAYGFVFRRTKKK